MARYDLAVLELAEPVTGIEPLPVATADPRAGHARDDPRPRPAALVRARPRGRRRSASATAPGRSCSGKQEIVSDAACRSYYAHNRYKRDFFDAADMICSLDPRSRPSRAAGAPWTSVCVGDSGGPLVAGGKLVGVTSWSEWCGAAPRPGGVRARRRSCATSRSASRCGRRSRSAPPTVAAERRRLTCVAPALRGRGRGDRRGLDARSASGEPCRSPKATGLTLDAPAAGAATRARSARATRAAPSRDARALARRSQLNRVSPGG